MIDAVLMFGFMNIVFEFVLLSMLAPRWRLRLLGNATARHLTHMCFLVINLVIHWGTLIGTMSAVLAFISSMLTVQLARKLYGFIEQGRYYHVGYIAYSRGELQ